MINHFSINYVTNALITNEVHDKIITIKNQHWQYPKETHEKWRRDNLNDDDCHLWLENKTGEIFAYLNFVFLKARFDTRIEDIIGIGNVCVNKDLLGRGEGLLLMQICNYYISMHNKPALLLCKRKLSAFYEKSGWFEYQGKLLLKGDIFEESAMFNKLYKEELIQIERKF